jgi:4-amino-4-deoxychorismate lyase
LGLKNEIQIQEIVNVPDYARSGIFKCRIIYSTKIEKIEFLPHKYREIKSIKLVECNEIDYSFKYEDRTLLNQLFQKRGNCDDILIIKNNTVTDSYYANVVFYDGKNWCTPDTPLLRGTQREKLLEEKKISETTIFKSNIPKYKYIGFINALNNLNEMPVISTKNVFE